MGPGNRIFNLVRENSQVWAIRKRLDVGLLDLYPGDKF